MKLFTSLITLCISVLTFGQTYTGQVFQSDSEKKPVPYSKVYFVDIGTTVQSDVNGKFEITNAPKGSNHVIVSAFGYETVHLDIILGPEPAIIFLDLAHHELDKVIISNDGLLHRETITNAESHKMSDINKIPSTTLGEAIANIPGVYQASIGSGVSKPVIRGLSGSRVVTYVNNLRIENQQWGNDHGLPITSVGIGNVEVIKGPASLLYGADALGGVLYFVDEPYEERNKMSGYIKTRFEHNNLGSSNEAGFRYSKDAFRINVYGGFDSFADYGVPDGRQVLNSRFTQAQGKVSMGYVKDNWVMDVRYNYYFGRIGLPGHTHDSLPDLNDFLTTTQRRDDNIPKQVIQNHFLSVENKFFFRDHQLIVMVGNTNNDLHEHDHKIFTPEIQKNLNNTLYNIKWRAKINENWESTVGSQGMLQINTNGETATEILVPDSRTADIGVFGMMRYKLKKWRFLFGGRFDRRDIATFNTETFKGAYNGLNYSAGFAYMGKKSTARFNVSSGFRAPNSSELLADGVHHGSWRYELGNTALVSEQSIQIDASYALHFNDLELIVNPFFNYLQNYIYVQKLDSIIGSYNVFEYTQTPSAILYGTDFGFHYHPHGAHWLHIESSFSTVFAEDENKNPIPFIPQTRINSQLRFDLNMKGMFQIKNIVLQHLYLFEQNRLGILETVTPAYQLLNAGINMKVNWDNPLFISAGVRNILNEEFIDHLSFVKDLGIQAPGINVYASVRYEFGRSLKKK
jgi:iron complex outermembrane receptor protein